MGTEAIQGMAIDLMKVNGMSVDENVFCNLQNLRLLQLNHICDTATSDRSRILRDCNLSDDALPRDLGSLRSLTNLELGRNSFRSLPASLSFELHIIGKIARHIISFTILRGINVCIVCSSHLEKEQTKQIRINLTNHTMGFTKTFRAVAINLVKSCEDHLWQGHLSNKVFKLGSEDEVELIVDCGNTMIVKKTGVYLVFEQDEARLNSKRSLDTDDVAGSSCDNLLQTKRMRFETSQQNIDENMDCA
ncbi:hypothetical protein OIU85_003825 [Salix viminalis]|uniref:Uncharacterized protein n=1 Tax=Salix viminalis TaxID=40686 RepID=A0A9Q0T123_SALVM|nr:hypothetical protein OIU85_003825 [Salix viminalis]